MPNNQAHDPRVSTAPERVAAPVGLTVAAVASGWQSGAPPSLSSLSGTFAQGNSLTISGSNLSANRNGQFFFKSFDGGTSGADAVSEFQKGSNTYLFASTNTPAQKATCARYEVNNTSMTSTRLSLPGGFAEAWMHCDLRIDTPDADSAGDEQIKLFRFVQGSADDHTLSPYLGWIWEMGQSWMQSWFSAYQSETVMSMNPGTKAEVPGVWRRWSMGFKASSLGVADGYVVQKNSNTDDPSNSSSQNLNDPAKIHNNKSWKTSPRITVESGNNGNTIGQLFLPFYHRPDQHSVILISNLWVNDSPEQVIFGDASTLETCTTANLVIQPMTARSEASVTVACEEGPNGELASGPVYAFVFNKDGLYNETGLQVRAA